MNYALVGVFVLALGAALVAGALWLAAGGASRQAHELYLALVDESVAGLNLNANGRRDSGVFLACGKAAWREAGAP